MFSVFGSFFKILSMVSFIFQEPKASVFFSPKVNKALNYLFLSFSFQMETASIINETRYYVMAVTPTRLYSFTGFGTLEVSQIL